MKRALPFLLAASLAPTSGCTGLRARNAPLEAWDPSYGYRATVLQEKRPLGNLAVVLAFSGGGTRAGALAYGVLQELRETSIPGPDGPRQLLDEVDVITSVSGGSFASAYYGLFGDRIFDDFESRFLRRNLERELLLRLFNPINWFRMLGPYDRTELALRLYDETIFERSTFADLQAAQGPLLMINASDLGIGARFTFFQDQFDVICSDLSPMEVARAVTASSAVPVVFDSITLRNYAGECGFQPPAWIAEALERPRSGPRYTQARILSKYLDAKGHPYLHLVDGGVVDNTGLRAPMERVDMAGGIADRLRELGAGPSHIVVIAVDSEVNPPAKFSLLASPPSLADILSAVTGGLINRYTTATIEAMREQLQIWASELPPGPDGPAQTFLVDLAFNLLPDPEDRAYFDSVPTSLTLEDEQGDRVIAAGRQLLRSSPDFQALLESLR